ncbi:MAG: hypothetical protein Sylvanvirus28_6 [Sylvanvirus sp.]|uniref:Uncharacterized protein n=1 Tax=Sylvanvirus sp. TaxID=2487774 RepID=A0A3G5AIU8_9VIRU|nr:MAG: hypothetical protein Sylvanvirus28_6 [Sylvanvirus sp.]
MSSASSASDTVSSELQAWNYAKEGNLIALKELYQNTSTGLPRQFILDMALMGSTKGETQTEQTKACKAWAWMNGACILWDIQQSGPEYEKQGNDRNNRLMRLGGAGEVSKGTFSN